MQRLRLVVTLALAASCRSTPSDAELDRLHAETVEANERAKQEALASAPAGEPGYSLTVSGQIQRPSGTLEWSDLQMAGKATIETVDIQNPDKKTPTKFRGVLVRDVLARFAAAKDAVETTVVAIDGFRATIQTADAYRYDMLFAVEADGRPIPRSRGGPIYLVYPFSTSGPELRDKYPDRFWAFYVTHAIVGTETPHLLIDGTPLDKPALDKLPRATFDGLVGWKVEWPADAVHLRGVRLADALAAAHVTLPATGRVIVRGKAAVHSDPKKPIAFTAADLESCKPLLALQYGTDERPIPARLGGPIALAVEPCALGDRPWVTFVEDLEIAK